MINIKSLRLALLSLLLSLVACSGSNTEDKVFEINVNPLTTEVIADGSSSATINAVVKDVGGALLSGVNVTFQTNLGGFNGSTDKSVSASTNSNGIASVSLASNAAGTATLTATAGIISSSTSIIFKTNSNDQIASLSLSASQAEVMVGTTQTVLISGVVKDVSGEPLSGVNVTFTSNGGQLTRTSGVSDDNGIVSVGLNSTQTMTAGVVTVTATAGGFLAASSVTYREDISEQVASVKLGVSQVSVLADGNSNIVLSAQAFDSDGNALLGAEIKFSTTLGDLANDTVLTREDNTSNKKLATTTIKSSQTGPAEVRASVGNIGSNQSITFTQSVIEPILPSSMSISASRISVTSNNANKSLITATVLDSSNAALPGVTVRFRADGGQLSLASVVSDENGEASVNFSSGSVDLSNRIATVTAITGSLEKQIPIQVTGSALSIESKSNSLILGTGTASDKTLALNLLAKNSNGDPIYDTNLSVSIDSTSTGSGSLSVSSGKTDIEGKLQTTLTALTAGSLTVTVSGLGTSNSATFVINQVEQAFQITTPVASRINAHIGDSVNIQVRAPSSANVKFVTSLGTLTGTSGSGKDILEAVSSGTVQASLTATDGGAATVEVFDASDRTVIDRLIVDFSSPAASATSITIQADRNIVPLKVGNIEYQAKVIARVFDANNIPVSNASVWFSIENSTGGGEWLSPIYGTTAADGSIETLFTSGTISSDQSGVIVKALLDNGTDQFTDEVPIVVGGTAGSLVIGRGTAISTLNKETAYSQPMSVLVADSNGNPIAGNNVSISAWPVKYYKGYWTGVYNSLGELVYCTPRYTAAPFTNEDNNENLILDSGEDSNGDNYLTPGNSAAGTLPQLLTTDENGLATYDLTYLKHYSAWVDIRIKASTLVQGTETTSVLVYRLAALNTDSDECLLPASPFGSESFEVTSNVYTIVVGSSATIEATRGVGPYNFTVDAPNYATIVAVDADTATLTGLAEGIVTVVVTDRNNVIGYSAIIRVDKAP